MSLLAYFLLMGGNKHDDKSKSLCENHREEHKSSISVQNISIVDAKTEIIVNSANEALKRGGGVCGAIFKAAGVNELQNACDAIGGCKTGSTAITEAFHMPCKFMFGRAVRMENVICYIVHMRSH